MPVPFIIAFIFFSLTVGSGLLYVSENEIPKMTPLIFKMEKMFLIPYILLMFLQILVLLDYIRKRAHDYAMLAVLGRKKKYYGRILYLDGWYDRFRQHMNKSFFQWGWKNRPEEKFCTKGLRQKIFTVKILPGSEEQRLLSFFRITIKDIKRSYGKTVIMVTHDPKMASYCDRIMLLKDGVILDELRNEEDQKSFYRSIVRKKE